MHDQNFKNLILDYPREALAFFAKDETIADLSEARIIPIRQEQLKDRLGDRFRELDVPLLVEWPDGNREAILFVLEEETQTNRFSIYRLAHYCLDLAELMETDRVIPIVIFLNTGTRKDRLRLGGDNNTYLEFNYLSCDLKRLSAHDFKDSDNIIARLNLPNMHYQKHERLPIYFAAQLGLLTIESNPNKQRKYIDFIDFYANLSEEEMTEFRTNYLNKAGEMMGLAQILKEEGRQEEASKLFLLLLKSKFGSINQQLQDKVRAANAELIESWTKQIFDATTAEELLDG